MKKFLLILVLPILLQAGRTPTMECRYVGVVIDYKIMSFNQDNSVICWIQTGQQQYLVKGFTGLPKIYVNDSLYEY